MAAPPQRAQQGGAEQEGDPDRGEMAVARRFRPFVEAVGIDDRQRLGKRARAFVVIDDDHLQPGGAGGGERLERLGAAIDRHHQLRTALRDPHQRLARGTIALHQPIGNVDAGPQSERAQQPHQQRRRGGAVHVIIAEDGHRLAPRHRVGQPFGGGVHVAEAGRVGHEAAQGGQAVAFELRAGDAAGHQQLIGEIVGAEACIHRLARRRAPAPGLAGERALDAADERGGHQHGRQPSRCWRRRESRCPSKLWKRRSARFQDAEAKRSGRADKKQLARCYECGILHM
jgi:hypothetical protein